MGTITVNSDLSAVHGWKYYTLKDFNEGLIPRDFDYHKFIYLELVPFDITSEDVYGDDFVLIKFCDIKFYFGWQGDLDEIYKFPTQNDLCYLWKNNEGDSWQPSNGAIPTTFADFTDKLNNGVFNGINPLENLRTEEIVEFDKDAAKESFANKILNNFRLYYKD